MNRKKALRRLVVERLESRLPMDGAFHHEMQIEEGPARGHELIRSQVGDVSMGEFRNGPRRADRIIGEHNHNSSMPGLREFEIAERAIQQRQHQNDLLGRKERTLISDIPLRSSLAPITSHTSLVSVPVAIITIQVVQITGSQNRVPEFQPKTVSREFESRVLTSIAPPKQDEVNIVSPTAAGNDPGRVGSLNQAGMENDSQSFPVESVLHHDGSHSPLADSNPKVQYNRNPTSDIPDTNHDYHEHWRLSQDAVDEFWQFLERTDGNRSIDIDGDPIHSSMDRPASDAKFRSLEDPNTNANTSQFDGDYSDFIEIEIDRFASYTTSDNTISTLPKWSREALMAVDQTSDRGLMEWLAGAEEERRRMVLQLLADAWQTDAAETEKAEPEPVQFLNWKAGTLVGIAASSATLIVIGRRRSKQSDHDVERSR